MGLGEQLKRAIADSGMSQRRLAGLAGVHQPQIAWFMAGKRSLSVWAAGKIAEVVGLELAPGRRKGGLEAGLRQAIADSGMNLNRISALSGVDSGNLYRFIRGDYSMRLPAAEKIAGVLRLELKPRLGR